ncbi:MAG: hypothetical protein WB810_05830 [Candidatus Cybelea sp.]
MNNKQERQQQLKGAEIDNPASAKLIDDFYTDFPITEDDKPLLERFLASALVEVRREALIGLIFSTSPEGPKFTGYAIDALILHGLSVVAKSEAVYTAVSILTELRARGDKEAERFLRSLGKNDEWRRRFLEVHVAKGSHH